MTPVARDSIGRRERFRTLYAAEYPAINAYVSRRLRGAAQEVPDVVAEIFTVAWRRLDEVPAADDGRVWMYALARHALLNHHRSGRRRGRLAGRLKREATPRVDASDSPPALWLTEAIERLPDPYREALRLVFWDGCSHAEAGRVLGCSANAVSLRLHKAKARLRADPLVARHFASPRSDLNTGVDMERTYPS
jgi:RNA polymerase sigma-70 factor (ECF subfamily)